MSALQHSWDPKGCWTMYVPSDHAPWDMRRVVHLHRRAGFAATWPEIQRDLADGPAASIDRFLSGKARSTDGWENLVNRTFNGWGQMENARAIAELRAWWIRRMLLGPDPLGERLTLMWHNHFATGAGKAGLMVRRQNEVFREFARAPFGELLKRTVHDPALLLWLDGSDNRKGRPNENLARELMELFTLGVGHYRESDVREAARSLTGWKVTPDGQFTHWPANHDHGEKTLFGKTGHWDGDDVVRMLLEHPAIAERLAWRLCNLLMGEGVLQPASLSALAVGLRAHNLDVGWGVATVLRSQAFFAEANISKCVLGPIEYVVGPIAALELTKPMPSCLVLGEWAAHLGQDLFNPPNVGGWPGGRSWLAAQYVIGRANYATYLVRGRLWAGDVTPDFLALVGRHAGGTGLDQAVTFFGQLLTGMSPGSTWRSRLLTSLAPGAQLNAPALCRLVALMLASPEFQLT